MTSPEVGKSTLPEMAEVASDFHSTGTDCHLRKRKSLVTSPYGSAPLPKGRVEERESHSRSLSLLPEKDQRKSTPTLAAYAGAISRFCDLHGLTPDATAGDKVALEFDAFNRYLADLTAERRRLAELNF